MDISIILLIVAVVVVGFAVILYNRLVALRQSRLQAFNDIDVQLKLRYDLIPNLIETVKGYASHEKQLLEKVTEARANAMKASTVAERGQAEAGLQGALMNLYAVSENYPDLKANANFMSLQNELSDIENKVAAARRFFNNATQEYNTAIQQFPALLIAKQFGFHQEDFFTLPDEERARVAEPPKVAF